MHASETSEVTIFFRTAYNTYLGQQLFVIGDHPLLGGWSREKALEMRYVKQSNDSYNWVGKMTFRKPKNETVTIEYKYIILTSSLDHLNNSSPQIDVRLEKEAEICWDSGPNRQIRIGEVSNPSNFVITTSDLFQPSMDILEHVFLKNTFRDVIYRHEIKEGQEVIGSTNNDNTIQVRFRVLPIQLPPEYHVYITGDSDMFNNWNKYEKLVPINKEYYEYCVDLPRNTRPFDYKYLIMKTSENGRKIEPIIKWEHRTNRKCVLPHDHTNVLIFYDWMLKMPIQKFHGCGVLLPLYSIRSKQSFQGMGEFMDLKLLIDWCKKCNQLLIQLLPIQDTIFALDGKESNQSLQASSFAYNPIYLSLRKIQGFQEGFVKQTRRRDFVSVYLQKSKILREIYQNIDRNQLRNDPGFISFVKHNEYWIYSYCTWANIRDKWLDENPPSGRKEGLEPSFPPFEEVQIIDFLSTKDINTETPEEIGCLFQAWVQYQCHMQLEEVSEYARNNRIVLACTLTIGQRHKGADVWSHREIFNTTYNLGSPPDNFSFHGQNWWYPAWNWDEMRITNYQWLHEQIVHHEEYFRACLFDHPLGLFRCWVIPSDTENPLLGHYVPSIPICTKDLNDLQLRDISQFCRPIFPINDALSFSLPENMKERIINMLATCEGGVWRFRAQFETDTSVKEALAKLSEGITDPRQQFQFELAQKILLSQHESVCLIPDKEEPHRKYYPRFSMTDSNAFKLLSERDAQVLYKLYVDFYYRTNLPLWLENGQQNLSVLCASSIQFFGYDLGVTLNEEEKTLNSAGICSYRVQRIPRESTQRFDQTSSFPYLSICTPSPHDLPHLAAWWKQERADVQFFYHQILKMPDNAPPQINTNIVHGIFRQNLASDSMWCVFVFDDLLALSDEFSDNMKNSIWINDPSREQRRNYRVKPSLEELLEHEVWISDIVKMIEDSGRGRNVEKGFSEISP